ncbi:MAG TPA: SpoIIE family protein phosphatase [Aquihabitans sp.]|nr:SpoIIE family protein phosphatase [Aquihabitans sp.]
MTSVPSPGELTAGRSEAALARLGRVGLGAHELEDVLREAMVATAETVQARDAALFDLVGDGALLRGRAGLLDGRLAGRRTVGRIGLPVDRASLPGFAASEGRTIVSADIHVDDRFGARADDFAFPGRAAIAAPLGWEEHPIGVLVVYDRSPRSWSDEEVHLVQAVATTMGLALQRARVETDLRDSSARLDISLSAGGLGAWSWEVGHERVELSGSAQAVFGLAGAGFAGDPADFLAVIHPDDRERFQATVSAAIDEPAGEHHVVFRIVRPDTGALRWIEAWGRPLRTEARGLHLVGVCTDVTERRFADAHREELLAREHAARLEAEAARERLAFLAEASEVLGRSLEVEVTVARIAELVVPHLADVCFLDLVDEQGELAEQAGRGRTEEALAAARALRERRRRLGPGDPTQTGHAAAMAGRAVLYPTISDAQLVGASVDAEHRAAARRLDPRSTILAPLVSRGRPLGVLTLVRTGQTVPYDDDDLALVEELAGRAALAIDNGRLYQSRARVARSLQAALLPPALPALAGVALAARYDVAETDVAIGGDFYDLVARSDGSWGVVVGDVCGRGPDAAALTGLVRHTVRTAAVREQRPSAVLAHTNEAVLQQIDDARFCTAAYLHLEVLDPVAGAIRVVASSAGHPCPIVVRAGGTVEPLRCEGTLLGVVADPRLVDVTVELGPWDAIVLYTDGVTEARRGPELFGDERLHLALSELAGQPAEVIAAGLEASVAAYRRSARDDTAILVVQAMASA